MRIDESAGLDEIVRREMRNEKTVRDGVKESSIQGTAQGRNTRQRTGCGSLGIGAVEIIPLLRLQHHSRGLACERSRCVSVELITVR